MKQAAIVCQLRSDAVDDRHLALADTVDQARNSKMTFPLAEKQLETVLAPLGENRWADAATVSDAELALNLLEQEVLKIRAALGEIQNREKLKRMLAAVIEEKKRLHQELTAGVQLA